MARIKKIRPLPGYCLIEPIEEENVSAGGVYVPETGRDKPSKGKIIDFHRIRIWDKDKAIDWCIDGKSTLKIGQIVVYKKWTNQEVKHEGKDYLLVKFDELLAIIE